MSAKSRRKGQKGQLEWAKYIDGTVIARTGYEGPDVLGPGHAVSNLRIWEVKRRAEFPKWLLSWFSQTTSEGADAIAFRVDRNDWWIAVPASRLERT